MFGQDDVLMREIQTRSRLIGAAANELIIDYDDPTSDVYFVRSGMVRVLYRTSGGKLVILGEIGAGQLFGELAAIDGASRSANVTALQRSELHVMPGAAFLELLDLFPRFNTSFRTLLARRIRKLNERLAEFSFLQAKHRLYAELLRLSAPRTGHAGQRAISPPPVQHDLANRIGARREVVSRELASLMRERMVERTRGALVLHDPTELNRRISAALDE